VDPVIIPDDFNRFSESCSTSSYEESAFEDSEFVQPDKIQIPNEFEAFSSDSELSD